MKRYLLLLALNLICLLSKAQVEREELPAPSGPLLKIHITRIFGKVVDNRTGKGIEAATVQLYTYVAAADGSRKDSMIAGMFTRNNGDFSFESLPKGDSFRVLVSGVGYKATAMDVRLGSEEEIDLGNISIEQETQLLTNVVVTAQRPSLQMGIDRKIFSVEQNITSTGGTALDVMRNIPSVSVDVEGNVQLRGSEPQIFVDGRPTILTLDQIPADQVERVELITNPSSKFDAASSGGIINVVMKRNRRVGLNGVVSAGAGHPGLLNSNLTLNARQGKFNVFASGTYNQSGGEVNGKTLRENRSGGTPVSYFNQYSLNELSRRFHSLRFGLDFFATNRTTLSVTQNISGGRFRNDQHQDQEYLNSNKVRERTGIRDAAGKNEFNRYNTQLNLAQKFAEQGKELSVNFNYNSGKGKEASSIVNAFYLNDGSPYGQPARVRNAGRNNNDQYTFQVDFVDPKGDDAKFETGIRSYINKQESLFSSYSIENGSETLLPLSNNYRYTERIHAAYISLSNKIKNFSYQAGLRAEVSRFRGELPDSARTFGYDYPKSAGRFFDGLFPSIFLSRQFGEDIEVQVNYTRRIRRPNFWQLNPFIDINDPVNLRQGNPLLQPEFVNSFEFNYSQDYTKGNFLGVLYYRNNLRDITRYGDTISAAQYAQLGNAAIDPNAILNTFINARSTNTIGAELTLQHRFGEQFEIVPTMDLQYRKVNADAGSQRLSNEGFTWEGQLTLNFKTSEQASSLLRHLGIQLTGEYESSEVTAQGRNAAEYRVDFALRKDFLKDRKANLTFNINDVFNTHRFINIFDTDRFYQESFRRRNVRGFRISFTYKFGKQDFSLFRREDRQGDEND